MGADTVSEFAGARSDEPLEQRIARIEDVEAIKRLKAKYAEFCDTGYDADGMVSLFAEDGVWEGNVFGVHHGREAIRKHILSFHGQILWALHFMVCPVIDVAPDGLSATGTWYLYEPCTLAGAEPGGPPDAAIITAKYADEFVKRDGRWWFKKVGATFEQISNLDQGWVRQPFRGQ